MAELRIGITGAAGRMGQMLVRQVLETPGCVLAGASERPGSPAIGRDAAALAGLEESGLRITDDPAPMFAGVDAVLDFTAPAAGVVHAGLAARAGIVHVLGTSGLTGEQEAAVADAARRTPIVYAANMAVGVTLLIALVEQVAGILGDDHDIEILEMHHRHKIDAPSGTALALGQAAAKGRGVALERVAVRGRDGITGARQPGSIGFAALRGGDVVGDHQVVFAVDGERIELGHRASSRQIYARGAVRAALWAAGRPAGLYGMRDVLGL